MAEFEMPVEEQIRSLAKRFGTFETKLDSIDSKLVSIDSRLERVDSRLEKFDARLEKFDSRLEHFDSRLGSLDSRQDSLDSRQDTMASKLVSIDLKLDSISVRLDDTRQIAKLGLEALEGMRESNDKPHAEMRRDHDNQTDLLKSVLVHVRKRVERVEPPKRRQRS